MQRMPALVSMAIVEHMPGYLCQVHEMPNKHPKSKYKQNMSAVSAKSSC